MALCLSLASKGTGFVSPNPLVGCVIVSNGKILGRGYHESYGGPHAEVNAVRNVIDKGRDVAGSTVYVSLEPCAHSGKTPPCAEMLAKLKPARVVIGTADPFHKVNGKGIEILRKAGVKVDCGILETECRELNKFFFTLVEKKRPYVTLKIAQSIDGKIALSNYKSKYITSEASRLAVHKMRSAYDAVLIGRSTAFLDNPALDTRLSGGRPPLRIVIDSDLTLPGTLRIFSRNNASGSIVIHRKGARLKRNMPGVKFLELNSRNKAISVKEILSKLAELGISSVMVEGGSRVFSDFLKSGMFDEVNIFVAPKIIGRGLSAFDEVGIRNLDKSFSLELQSVERLPQGELLINYRNVHRNS